MKYIKDIVLTEEQKDRYTNELESNTWAIYFDKRQELGWMVKQLINKR